MKSTCTEDTSEHFRLENLKRYAAVMVLRNRRTSDESRPKTALFTFVRPRAAGSSLFSSATDTFYTWPDILTESAATLMVLLASAVTSEGLVDPGDPVVAISGNFCNRGEISNQRLRLP